MKILITLLLISASVTYAADGDISFDNESYQTRYVEFNLPGCSGDFRRTLEQNIRKDNLSITVSVNYNIDVGIGSATASINSAAGKVVSDMVLHPLGISGIYAFGNWWEPVKITINKQDYDILGATFTTIGASDQEWIANGVGAIFFSNPPTPTKAAATQCSVSSKITLS